MHDSTPSNPSREGADTADGEPARPGAGDPARPNAGDPARPNAGGPVRPNAGDRTRLDAGDPVRPGAGDPTAPGGDGAAGVGRSDAVAIALTAAAVVLYEVAITRILSVVLWYHFAFLSVSLAMLGLGAPGVWLALRPRDGRELTRTLGQALLAAGIAIPGSVVLIFKLGPLVRGWGGGTAIAWLVALGVLAPMLALGAAVCLLLVRARGRRVGRIYAADLLGATAGAILVLPLMWLVPTPLIVAGAGLLPLAAAWLVDRTAGRVAFESTDDGRAVSRRALLACLALLAGGMLWGEPFHLRYTKDYAESVPPLLERWTPTARITLYDRPIRSRQPDRPWGWGFGEHYRPQPFAEWWIEQDGSAGTPIVELTGTPAELAERFLFHDVTSVGYQLRPADRVCVIGAGGGRDVLTALAGGARAVDAVEINGGIVDALTGPARAFSGDVYHLPGVRAVVSEGRSHLERHDARYDLLQLSLVDSWAATAAGAYALSENYLYTVEAFRLYWRRLEPTGLVSVSRYAWGSQQFESARLARVALAALEQEGVAEPARHLAIAQAGMVATLLVSRTPFAAEDIARLDAVSAARGFTRIWPPASESAARSMVTRVLLGGTAGFEALGLDLSPPTDDRPFFFQAVSIVGRVDPELRRRLGFNDYAVVLLRRLVAILAGVTLVMFALPFALVRRLPRGPDFWRGSAYFAAIGVAFMLIELTWIQRFILHLGHPSYAMTVVVGALLAGAGLGALVAGRMAGGRAAQRTWAVALPLVVLLANAALAPLSGATLAWSLPLRAVVAAALVLPAGFVMGFPFPLGMILFGERHKPWFWAVNGVAGVLGSALSLALAMLVGFTAVGWMAVAGYGAAVALLWPRLRSRASGASGAPRTSRAPRTSGASGAADRVVVGTASPRAPSPGTG